MSILGFHVKFCKFSFTFYGESIKILKKLLGLFFRRDTHMDILGVFIQIQSLFKEIEGKLICMDRSMKFMDGSWMISWIGQNEIFGIKCWEQKLLVWPWKYKPRSKWDKWQKKIFWHKKWHFLRVLIIDQFSIELIILGLNF